MHNTDEDERLISRLEWKDLTVLGRSDKRASTPTSRARRTPVPVDPTWLVALVGRDSCEQWRRDRREDRHGPTDVRSPHCRTVVVDYRDSDPFSAFDIRLLLANANSVDSINVRLLTLRPRDLFAFGGEMRRLSHVASRPMQRRLRTRCQRFRIQ